VGKPPRGSPAPSPSSRWLSPQVKAAWAGARIRRSDQGRREDEARKAAPVIQYAFFIDWNKFVYERFREDGLIQEPSGPPPERETEVEERESEPRDAAVTFERRVLATPEEAPRSGAMWGEPGPDL
jgi:hypothetical protein